MNSRLKTSKSAVIGLVWADRCDWAVTFPMVKELPKAVMQDERSGLKSEAGQAALKLGSAAAVCPATQLRREDHSSEGTAPNIFLTGSVLSDRSLGSCLRLRDATEGDDARVIFFDLDNTLYSKETGIAEEMGQRIRLYFEQFLHLPREEAATLGQRYYLDYGLAIRGLIQNFSIDPAHYDAFVDGGLQLEQTLGPDARLATLLAGIHARRWVFTNAGLPHARRVLRLLGVEEHFEGIIYCDYSEPNFPAKPDRLAYERAMRCAGATPDQCYFVDDSISNVRTATELGWHAVHLDERHDSGSRQYSAGPSAIQAIASLGEISEAMAELFGAGEETGEKKMLAAMPAMAATMQPPIKRIPCQK